VMAGGLMGAIIGPNLAMHTKNWLRVFLLQESYVALAVIAMLSMALMSYIEFPPCSAQESQ
jgi:hypothetical protein